MSQLQLDLYVDPNAQKAIAAAEGAIPRAAPKDNTFDSYLSMFMKKVGEKKKPEIEDPVAQKARKADPYATIKQSLGMAPQDAETYAAPAPSGVISEIPMPAPMQMPSPVPAGISVGP